MITVGEVIERLREEGELESGAALRIAEGYRPALAPSSHWSLRIMIGVGAWISAALFLVFLFGMEIVRSSRTAVGVGLFFLVVTCAARLKFMGSTFFRQLFLVLNLSGLIMFLGGLSDVLGSQLSFGIGMALTGISVIVFYPDRIQRFVAVFVSFAGILVTIHELANRGILYGFLFVLTLTIVYFWEAEGLLTAKWGEGVHRPLAYGLSCALMVTILFGLSDERDFVLGEIDSPLATGIIAAVLAVLAVRADRKVGHVGFPPGLVAALLGIILLAFAASNAPGILASLLLLVLSFRRDNQILLVMSLFFITVFLGAYYYSLEMTLIEKAYLLISTGAFFLAARFGMTYLLITRRKAVENA